MSIPLLVRGRSLVGLSKGMGVGVGRSVLTGRPVLAGRPALAGLLALAGCAATDPPPLGSLDPNSTTFPGVVDTASTVTGTGTTGPVMACVPEAPPSDNISDFSDWSGTNWGATGALTGKSFTYHGPNTLDPEYQVDHAVENMHITVLVEVGDYAGFGMQFDPCTDATGFSGIQFDLSGAAGGAVFQVQTSEDQNEEYGDARAVCSEEESGSCAAPQVRIAEVTATPTTLQFAWEDFNGGSPVYTLSPNQILGLQWQFECSGAEACPVDVRLDNVKFY